MMTIREAVTTYGRKPEPGEPKINVAREIFAKMGSTPVKLSSVIVEYSHWLKGQTSAEVRQANRKAKPKPKPKKEANPLVRIPELLQRRELLEVAAGVIGGILSHQLGQVEAELRQLMKK